jgi:hypothetical protein
LPCVLIVSLLAGCGLEEDEPAVAEAAAELEIIGGPIFARPAITSISPTSAAPGATVTISGGGFDTLFRGPAAFGSTTSSAARATLTYVSPTRMTVVVPAGAQQGPIYVLSAFGLVGQPLPVQLTSPQVFTPLVAPAAPSNLGATVASSSRVNLSWRDNSWNETGFNIWIQDAAGWRSLKSVGANLTSDAITGLSPSTSYSFRVRAQNATGSSGYTNTVTVTTGAAVGTVVLTNNAQVGISQVTFNGVPRAGVVNGNQATFSNVAAGAYYVEAVLSLASGDWVCSLGNNVTVVEGQTRNINVAALTAAQVLTHCSGAIDYDQGGYTDLSGYHTVRARINANGTFNWWLDNVAQQQLTIFNTSFNEPWLSFELTGGDVVSMGWPFGSMQLWVNGYPVQLTRASGW